jgi:hypothetical protein
MKFEDKYKHLLEGFGGPLTKKMYAPRIQLSEEFKEAFREEFKRLCEPTPILDENNEVVGQKDKNPSKILEQIQKALLFLSR